MTGENVICFAKDWNEEPTSNNHVMTELARENRVLWLNSVATRAPKLGSGRDVAKIFRKLAGFFRGARQAAPNLWVYTPIVLPFPHSRLAARANRLLLRAMLRRVRKKLGMRDFQLWTFLPNTADYVGSLGESVSVYYCVDEWSKFSSVDGPRLAAAERRLVQSADLVFATGQSLVDARAPLNRRTYLARHGVDHALFAAALDDATRVPGDIAALPKPVLGFYGTIQDWVDLELIAYLAERHSEWTIVLIGKAHVDVSNLARFTNVHLLGRRDHAELPGYCKGFAVALVPQKVNELTTHMNPIKLREYLSAGLPVVSTALPEVAAALAEIGDAAEGSAVAGDYAAFERAVAAAVGSDTPELRRRRSEAMRGQTWERKVREIGDIVLRVKAERSGEKIFSPRINTDKHK